MLQDVRRYSGGIVSCPRLEVNGYSSYVICPRFYIQSFPDIIDLTRNDVVKIGEVPPKLIEEASNGRLHEPWPAQVNKLVQITKIRCLKQLTHVLCLPASNCSSS